MSRMSTLLVTTESSLPPNEHGKTSGYLEIDVIRINFTALQSPASNHTPKNQFNITKKTPKRCCSKKFTGSRLNPVPVEYEQGIIVKIIWCGQNSNTASGVRICMAYEQTPPAHNNQFLKQQQPQEQLKCGKVRYSIQTSLRLFLEYLRSCKTLEIYVAANVGTLPICRAQVRLPKVFVRKFAANYVAASNFEHKTKIYALYTAQSKQSSKCGEFQLRFRIMFAPIAKHMLQEQLQSALDNELQLKINDGNLQKEQSAVHNKFPVTTAAPHKAKTDEIVENMMKIDANLAAYLAGENTKHKEEEKQAHAFDHVQCSLPMVAKLASELVEEHFHEQQLKTYQRVNTLKMHLEALTLQPTGTKYMELLEEDIKPIFTVECQLPNELIRHVPRYDMFHVMQFESGHFQSLTQCTRFAQDEEREIHLRLKDMKAPAPKDAGSNVQKDFSKLAFGRLYLAVWWRQPGTCLNEMLGMAEFDLEELYTASLLEQCKCLPIKRRNTHMASLYFKIGFEFRQRYNDVEQNLDCNGNKEYNVLWESDDEQSRGQHLPSDAKEANNMNNETAVTRTATTLSTAIRGADNSNGQMSGNTRASNNKNKNEPQLDTSEIDVETTKVRLLRGLLNISEVRHIPTTQKLKYFFICRRFWHQEATATAISTKSTLAKESVYQEQFSVLNGEAFLQSVEKKFLQLELWRLNTTRNDSEVQPYGMVHLPLHQYFIAYRDTAITNHLCKGKFPVISVDAWMPIVRFGSVPESAGDLKCLLAIGGEDQINRLRIARGIERSCDTISACDSAVKLATLFTSEPLECPMLGPRPLETVARFSGVYKSADRRPDHEDGFPDHIGGLPNAVMSIDRGTVLGSRSSLACPIAHAKSTTLSITGYKKCFEFFLKINRANVLPSNPPIKVGKKSAGKRHSSCNLSVKQSRFPPNEPPSVYVTFQAEDRPDGSQYKSHEGLVYATNIAEKCTQPSWNQRFRVSVSLDYLTNPQKSFILKVWKKAANNCVQLRSQPTPLEDAMIGWTVFDLGLFLRGEKIGGWFSVVDFNDRTIGQLELECHLIDDVHTLMQSICPFFSNTAKTVFVESFIEQFERSFELSHLNIGQAIKHKYSELEQISQRLRNRLSEVTAEKLSEDQSFSRLEHDMAASLSIGEAERAELMEFEKDLTTPPTSDEEGELQNSMNSTVKTSDLSSSSRMSTVCANTSTIRPHTSMK